LIGICWADATTEYTWTNLDEPFQETIKIPLYGEASVNVNIPAEYLEKGEPLTFRIFMVTPFVTGSGSDFSGPQAFSFFNPSISVNGSRFSGVYAIRYKTVSGTNQSNAYVKIKAKHLKAGMNNLTFNAERQDQGIRWSCGGNRSNCTAIFINRLWLER
jgi:hypothetical protein